MSYRLQRINELIKQETGKILQKEIYQGRYLITLTEVETSPDFKKACVKISILPYSKEGEALNNLKNSIGRIQHLLNKEIRMKFVPKIYFIIDRGAKSADAVDLILSKIDNR